MAVYHLGIVVAALLALQTITHVTFATTTHYMADTDGNCRLPNDEITGISAKVVSQNGSANVSDSNCTAEWRATSGIYISYSLRNKSIELSKKEDIVDKS